MLLEVAFVSWDQEVESKFYSNLFLEFDDLGYVTNTELLNRNYSINQRTLFDENYALASTQALKNKDIPEGGAKGTILPSYAVFIFKVFILDLTIQQTWC
jgi:hypothetical protein